MRTILLRAFLFSATLALLSLLGHPYVYSDQALQLNAVQAWQNGLTIFPNQLVSANPADLVHDHVQWEIWHPLGFPLLVAGLTQLGLSLSQAVQILAVTCFIAGCTGWSLWALCFRLPRALHQALPFLIPGIRYGNDNLLHFHAEAFLFAATPWALLATFSLLKTQPSPINSVQKFLPLIGLLPLLKYSAFLLLAGILLAFLLQKKSLKSTLPLTAVLFLPLFFLSVLNRLNGGAENLVVASLHPHLPALALLYLLGSVPLTLADAGQIAEAALLNPHYGFFPHTWIVPCLGLPGAIFLLFSGSTVRPSSAARLVFIVLAAHLALLLVIWTLCDGVGYDRRYLAPASLALLPWALSISLPHLHSPRAGLRIATLLFLLVYLFIPVLYGYATFTFKLRDSIAYSPAATELWNPLLSASDGKSVNAFLNLQPTPVTVWYLPEPILALDLRGRKIFGRPDWLHARAGDRELTSRPLRILALVPRDTPALSALAVLEKTFPQSHTWFRQSVPAANYDLWTGDLRP